VVTHAILRIVAGKEAVAQLLQSGCWPRESQPALPSFSSLNSA
jgi:hypothetical protein